MSEVTWRMIFSGLNLVVAGPKKAVVATMGLGSGAAGHGHGVAVHYPMLIVADDQYDGASSDPPTRVADLTPHIRQGWLSDPSKYLAFEIGGFDLTFKGLDVYTDMMVPVPGTVTGCPTDGWEDLGWLVPFSLKFKNGTFEPNWESDLNSVSCHTKLPNGYLSGAAPVDIPKLGLKVYNYAQREQVFSDSCLWRSASSIGSVTVHCKPRGNGVAKSIALKSANGRAINCYLFNHPKDPNTVPPGWHLGVVEQVFAKGQMHDPPTDTKTRCPMPGAVGTTLAVATGGVTVQAELQLPAGGEGSIVVKAVGVGQSSTGTRADHTGHADPNMGSRGEEYCAKGLVWEP